MSKHPLEDVFNIDSDGIMEAAFDVTIPEDPTLDTIIDCALTAYKSQMGDIGLIEPKNRMKYLEISERFLNQAKDAMHKKEQLKIMREKATTGSKTKKPDGETSSEEGVPRQALFEKLQAINGGKK